MMRGDTGYGVTTKRNDERVMGTSNKLKIFRQKKEKNKKKQKISKKARKKDYI